MNLTRRNRWISSNSGMNMISFWLEQHTSYYPVYVSKSYFILKCQCPGGLMFRHSVNTLWFGCQQCVCFWCYYFVWLFFLTRVSCRVLPVNSLFSYFSVLFSIVITLRGEERAGLYASRTFVSLLCTCMRHVHLLSFVSSSWSHGLAAALILVLPGLSIYFVFKMQ